MFSGCLHTCVRKKSKTSSQVLLRTRAQLKVRNYEGIDLHEVALLNESAVKNFSFAVYHDILMISFSTTVLEDAIRQLISNESLASLSSFNKMYATAGKNVDANVFINFQQFPKSLSAFVKTDFKSEVRSFKNFAGWAELDVNLMNDMMLMNGFVSPPDSVSSIASLFLNQNPQRITPDEVLPSSVASFLTISVSDAPKYFADYKSFLQDQGMLALQQYAAIINNAYGTIFPTIFSRLWTRKLPWPSTQNPENNLPIFTFFFALTARPRPKKNSCPYSAKLPPSKPSSVSSYTTIYRLDSELILSGFIICLFTSLQLKFSETFSVLDEHYL